MGIFGLGSDNIFIQIGARWLGSKAINQALREIANIEKASKKAKDATGEALGGSTWRNGQAGLGGKGVASLFSISEGWLAVGTGATAAGVGIGLAVKAMRQFNEVAEQGANLRQLEQSFNMFIESVERGPDTLTRMVDATNGTMSRFAAMENMLTLVAGSSMSVGQAFADAAPKLAEIAKAANKLNPTLGDTNFMFQSLARGVKRSETRLLDNLGLNIKVAAANTTFAAAVGKSVTELTAEEKQLALLNETLRVGENLIAQVGGETAAFGDAWINARSAMSDFRSEWKMAVSEFASASGWTDVVQSGADFVERLSARMRAKGKLNELYATNPALLGASDWGALRLAADNLALAEATEKRVDKLVLLNEQLERQAQKERAAAAEMRNALVLGERPEGSLSAYLEEESARQIELNERAVQESEKALEAIEKNQQRAADAMAEARRAGYEWIGEMRQTQADLFSAIREVQAKVGGYFLEAKDADKETSLFGRPISEIGPYSYRTNPIMEDDEAVLEKLKKAHDKALNTIEDYELGIKGLGMEQDKLNEKIAEQQALVDHLAPQINNIALKTAEYASGVHEAVFNQERLNEGLEDALAAQGMSAPFMARYALLTGDLTEAQADAALKAALMEDAFEMIARTAPTAEAAIRMLADETERIEALDLTKLFETDADITSAARANQEFGVGAFTPREEREYVKNLEDTAVSAATAARIQLEEELFGPVRDELEKEHELTVLADIEQAMTEIDRLRAALEEVTGIYTFVPEPFARDRKFDQKADGGTYYGGPMLVGERGPELLWPWGGGKVTPNHHLNGGGGGAPITINNYNREAAAVNAAMLGLARQGAGNALIGR